MNKQIDFVSIDKGAIRLYADDKCVALSNCAHYLADIINENGGAADKIRASSLFIEAVGGCELSAEEGGFSTSKEVADLWDEVCSYV